MNFARIQDEVKFTAVRGSGPGGQNVNKVSSCAQMHWDYAYSEGLSDSEKAKVSEKLKTFINKEGQLRLRSDSHRDLERNKEQCLEKLAELLEQAFFVPKIRKATKPTYSSKKKRQKDKMRRGEIKKMRRSRDDS